MKIKGQEQDTFVKGTKISGTVDNFTLSFGKFRDVDCDRIDKSYLQWMQENMQLSNAEDKLLSDIMGGVKPKKQSKAAKKPKKPLRGSKLNADQWAEIQDHEEKTRPPQPAKLDARDELRIVHLEASLKTANLKMLEILEIIHLHNDTLFPPKETKEKKKITRALNKFEAELDMDEEEAGAHPQEY